MPHASAIRKILKEVPLFALLDDDEIAVLAAQVELKRFAPRQRIYKIGEAGGRGYVMVSGGVQVTTVDDDHQDVVVDQPAPGEFFGFASMLDGTQHQTSATALEETACIEVERNDIQVLLQQKPHAGMDMLSVLGSQFHASQTAGPAPRDTQPERNHRAGSDSRGSTRGRRRSLRRILTFIITFAVVLVVYTAMNVLLRRSAWDPYPFILFEPVSVDARSDSGASDHDEPEPAGHEGSAARRARLRGEPASGIGSPGPIAQTEHDRRTKIDDVEELLRRRQGS